MSGETYVKRYPGGFVDLPAQSTAIDSQFLNAVEQALVRLLGEDPADGELGVWSTASGRLVYQLIRNAQLDPAAAISRTKLDFGVGLVDADIAPGAAISSSKITGITGTAPPSGAMMLYGGSVAPSGWLMCDGSAVSRATQAGIFSVIGTAYGVGDGTTTFNLPDFRGRSPFGVGTHGDVGSLGLNEGAAVADRRPKHAHSHSLTIGNDTPDHTHLLQANNTGGGSALPGSAAAGITVNWQTLGASTRHSHPLTGAIGAAGLTDGPAFLTVNVIIKT